MYDEEKEAEILTLLSNALDRIETLERELAEVKERQKGEELLKALPQGHDSGLDADLLDGKHLAEVLKKADEQTRSFVRRIESQIRAVALSYHGNELHNPHYEQYGLSLLLDGSRAMADDLDLVANKLLFSENQVYSGAVDTLYIRNELGGNAYLNVYWINTDRVNWAILGCTNANADVNTYGTGASVIDFRGHDGTTWRDAFGVKQNYLKLFDDVTAAVAAVAYRGCFKLVHGAGGARDRLYMCMKSDSDTYSWVAIADGGA